MNRSTKTVMKYWYQVANSKKYKPENLEKKGIKKLIFLRHKAFSPHSVTCIEPVMFTIKKKITYRIGSFHIPGET